MRKTKAEAAKTRRKLMNSALELFIRHGYASVSLQQIAEGVDSTRGAFYWYFKTKEDVLYAICDRERKFIEGLMIDLFSTTELSPDAHLKFVLTELVINYFDNKRFRDYIELTWFKVEHLDNNQVNYLKKIANNYFIEESMKIIDDGISQGLFNKNCDPRTGAIHMASVINGIYRLYFISPEYMSKKNALALIGQCLQVLNK